MTVAERKKQERRNSEEAKKANAVHEKTAKNVETASVGASTPDMSRDKAYRDTTNDSLAGNVAARKAVEVHDRPVDVSNKEAVANNKAEEEALTKAANAVGNQLVDNGTEQRANVNKQIKNAQQQAVDDIVSQYETQPANAEPAADTGFASEDELNEAVANPTEEDAQKADDELKDSGVAETDPATGKQLISKDKLMELLAQPHGQGKMVTFLNMLSALASVATLGLVPPINFGKLTGQTEYLANVNKLVDDYNNQVLSTYTAKVAGAQGQKEANEITASDTNANEAGANRYAETGEKAKEDAQREYDRWTKQFDAETQEKLLRLQNVYAQQMEKIRNLNQRGLLQQAHNLQASLEADTKRSLSKLYNSWDQSDRDSYAKGAKAANGTTFVDQGLKYLQQIGGIATDTISALNPAKQKGGEE